MKCSACAVPTTSHTAGTPDFTPSPVGPVPLPLPLPFAPNPLPIEEQPDGDIPFPVLRYEEELLAGMLVLQHQAGAVDSVDQLLALQPQCTMPPDLACHFQGSAHHYRCLVTGSLLSISYLSLHAVSK